MRVLGILSARVRWLLRFCPDLVRLLSIPILALLGSVQIVLIQLENARLYVLCLWVIGFPADGKGILGEMEVVKTLLSFEPTPPQSGIKMDSVS